MKDLSKWIPLAQYQQLIAERWLEKGEKSDSVFAKFFFYFTGFNALYFLWDKIESDRSRSKRKIKEEIQIESFVRTFCDESKAQAMLNDLTESISYFSNRTISRMIKRTAKMPEQGDMSDGMKWREALRTSTVPSERVVAMSHILYLVRCNLFHGSKNTDESGDDMQIVSNSLEPIRQFLIAAIKFTNDTVLSIPKQAFPAETF